MSPNALYFHCLVVDVRLAIVQGRNQRLLREALWHRRVDLRLQVLISRAVLQFLLGGAYLLFLGAECFEGDDFGLDLLVVNDVRMLLVAWLGAQLAVQA